MKKYNIINNALGWACFVIAAVTYLLTLEPTASFWDCPEFISQGAKLEVGHPPGNPIFMLTARFFVTLFGNNIANAAIAVNTMSALLSAATILLLFWTITHLIRRLLVRDDATTVSSWQMALIFGGGLCGALAYTWSDTFWFSAVEGEVYAFSSFCTALVFWLILKWENRADSPHSDRYLLLIAYVIGVSIAVHLLNLLCIPAIVLVFYYKKFKKTNAKGSLIALGISFVIVALILYGLVPGFVKVSQWFELLFVNGFGASYNMGVLFYVCLFVAVAIWAMTALYRQRSVSAIKWSFLLCVGLSGMLFIGSSWWVGLLLFTALAVYLWMFCSKVPVRIFNAVILSLFLIFVGYSSYALLLIRSGANPPMNQQSPDNVFTLASYLNREQYGDRPLFYGPLFSEQIEMEEYPQGSGQMLVYVDREGYPLTHPHDGVLRDENGAPYNSPVHSYSKVVKTDSTQPDKYVDNVVKPQYTDIPELCTVFPRMYSTDGNAMAGYKGWSQYETPDLASIPREVRQEWAAQGYVPLMELAPYLHNQQTITTYRSHSGQDLEHASVWKPSYIDNLRYFFNYQFSHMYWRYFMWNFAGRQNDFQGNGEPHLGNWISGIPFIDNARLGDQSLLPDEFGEGNKGHNVFYMLPLLLGIIGLLWQALYIKPDAPQRGIEQFWVVCFLFFMTGIAIVLYLNQTPGQPRERDYAFAGSFYAFAIWIGIGVPAIGWMLRSLFTKKHPKKSEKSEKSDKAETAEPAEPSKGALWAAAGVACAIGLAVPLQMVSQTWDDHDRSGRYTARDFGMNYLASVDPDGIIFCNGDNDTFPLWYAQEVEGYRRDVRVVNLSYLTAEWYANQQLMPSYEGKPVRMYAKPSDYAYGALDWSYIIPRNNEDTDAETALRELYASNIQDKFKALTSPRIYMPVDSAAAYARYELNPSDTVDAALRIPYLRDIYTDLSRTGATGLRLNNVLSLDMIANSTAGGFDRPVYYASTVQTSFYNGLTPYMGSTGMAMEVTPFYNAPVSPTVEKAYRNIMGEFRWGGLDVEHPERLYLDETVRRMVSSTRSSLYYVARDLIASGRMPASQWAREHAAATGAPAPQTRADMGRTILETLLAKLPVKAAPFDGMLAISLAECYYDLYNISGNKADLNAARTLLDNEIPRYAQLIRYAQSLTPGQLSMLGGSELQALQYLGIAIALRNRIDTLEKLEQDPEANADLIAQLRVRPSMDTLARMAPLVYVTPYTYAQLEEAYNDFTGVQQDVVGAAMNAVTAAQAAGLQPMALSDSIMTRYDINPQAWVALLHL